MLIVVQHFHPIHSGARLQPWPCHIYVCDSDAVIVGNDVSEETYGDYWRIDVPLEDYPQL